MNTIVLCPGFHSPQLTDDFLASLPAAAIAANWLVFPGDRYSAYSAPDVLRFVYERLNLQTSDVWLKTPLIFIGFSAGVVGAMGAAGAIAHLGGTVRALFALDGWGVPLLGNFPIHRLSHDYFTHWSSLLLGSGQDNFYADPPVAHLDLWRSLHTVRGQWVSTSSQQVSHPTIAAHFLIHWLQHYEPEAGENRQD